VKAQGVAIVSIEIAKNERCNNHQKADTEEMLLQEFQYDCPKKVELLFNGNRPKKDE
jgi:hypothetical protein